MNPEEINRLRHTFTPPSGGVIEQVATPQYVYVTTPHDAPADRSTATASSGLAMLGIIATLGFGVLLAGQYQQNQILAQQNAQLTRQVQDLQLQLASFKEGVIYAK